MKTRLNEVARSVTHLPVGQSVRVMKPIYAPKTYGENGETIEHRDGVVVEHIGGEYGGVAIKFDTYQNVVDYTNRETANIALTH